jgi:hypothetical protein
MNKIDCRSVKELWDAIKNANLSIELDVANFKKRLDFASRPLD